MLHITHTHTHTHKNNKKNKQKYFKLIGNLFVPYVYIIYVCTVYIYYVYINTHTGMYIFKKQICLYIKYLYII